MKDLVMNTPVTAKSVAAFLEVYGPFKAIKVTEPNEDEDGMVQLTPTLHVQVGYGYMNCVVQEGEGDDLAMTFFDECKSGTALLDQIRGILAKAVPQ